MKRVILSTLDSRSWNIVAYFVPEDFDDSQIVAGKIVPLREDNMKLDVQSLAD